MCLCKYFFQFEDKCRVIEGLVTPHRYAPSKSVRSCVTSSLSYQHADEDIPKLSNDSTLEDSSDSISNESYASAVGSQEDFTLVDLHMQINRMILDSPMLMSSYVTHLTQLKCSNWYDSRQFDKFSQPLFQKDGSNKLVYVGEYLL